MSEKTIEVPKLADLTYAHTRAIDSKCTIYFMRPKSNLLDPCLNSLMTWISRKTLEDLCQMESIVVFNFFALSLMGKRILLWFIKSESIEFLLACYRKKAIRTDSC